LDAAQVKGTLSCNGSGLTDLNASQINSGTIANTYLPADINRTSFTGNGSGLTFLAAANITGTVAVDKGGTGVTSLTTSKVLVGGTTVSSPAELHWNNTNKRLGVNNSSPSYALDVGGDINFSGSLNQSGSPFVASRWTPMTNGIVRNSRVGINMNTDPGYALHVTGEIFATSDITAFGTGAVSDAKYKENVQVVSDGLSKIKELRPVNFFWSCNVYNENRRGTRDVGFIAQEVNEVFPLLVRRFNAPNESTETLGIAYDKISPYIVKAIQEMDDMYSKKLDEMQKRIEYLESKLAN
jgi:hypothetical protein